MRPSFSSVVPIFFWPTRGEKITSRRSSRERGAAEDDVPEFDSGERSVVAGGGRVHLPELPPRQLHSHATRDVPVVGRRPRPHLHGH